MQIEAGKWYEDTEGRLVGPIHLDSPGVFHGSYPPKDWTIAYDIDGRAIDRSQSRCDLVKEVPAPTGDG